MRLSIPRVAVWVCAVMLTAGLAGLYAADTTMTGKISDGGCGAGKHTMGKSDADCVNMCAKDSGYVLVVAEKTGPAKIYKLTVKDAQKAELAKLAAKDAKITGTVAGDKITVTKVEAAK
jgi:hypothetical protein